MNQVGQHLGRTAGGGSGRIPGRTPGGRPDRTPRSLVRGLVHDLVHGDVRDRDAATWLLASVLTLAWLAGMAWALHVEATAPRPGSAAVLLGGWSLTLLPVHCARRFRRAARVPKLAGESAVDGPALPGTHGEGVGRDGSPPTPPGP